MLHHRLSSGAPSVFLSKVRTALDPAENLKTRTVTESLHRSGWLTCWLAGRRVLETPTCGGRSRSSAGLRMPTRSLKPGPATDCRSRSARSIRIVR